MPTEPPSVLLDWLSENVKDAFDEYWNSEPPCGLDVTDDGVTLTVFGPPLPPGFSQDQEDESEDASLESVYTMRLDLEFMLRDLLLPRSLRHGPKSDSERNELRENAEKLLALAKKIQELVSETERFRR
ncbi:MAG: hypothetical protein VBE63_15285 [Lamprobacter sp.]|uniref:hypothetical protein n=1 Tax=Lamprobacter sp. TaxID=3100796 RepID=UPI002B25FB15|nr:hypothetical protein [Lamprobacter sp.]MEA3641287.1 hypothetical protein [Lamprobacter sp.]